jgi:excisionase family DNA binding protein
MALAGRPTPMGEMLTLAEAAAIAHVHRDTIRSWCASGRLPSIGGTRRGDRRVRRTDLERSLADRRRRRLVTVPVARAIAPRVLRSHDSSGDTALRRLAADLSGTQDVARLFNDVLDDSIRLFQVDRVGLWLWEPGREHPLELAASRNVPESIVRYISGLPAGAETAGVRAILSGTLLVFRDARDAVVSPELREAYAQNGISTVCFVPVVFRGDPPGDHRSLPPRAARLDG